MGRAELIAQLQAKGISSPTVLAAMARVPRPAFVPDVERWRAWVDTPLPIGSGQTISQPYVVAHMLQWADVATGDRVLDVGTGCGYQAAVLAELGAEVVSVEIREELAATATQRLAGLGYGQVRVVRADGRAGYEPAAPFDCVLVAAASRDVPEALLWQLRIPDARRRGGRLVIPLGSSSTGPQRLWLVERTGPGLRRDPGTAEIAGADFRRDPGIAVQFVPLL